MAKKASSKKLQTAFTKHEKETERPVERLDQVFELLGKRAKGKDCPAMDGIIEEAEEVMKEAKEETIRDAAMLAAAQASNTMRSLATVRRWPPHRLVASWGVARDSLRPRAFRWTAPTYSRTDDASVGGEPGRQLVGRLVRAVTGGRAALPVRRISLSMVCFGGFRAAPA